MKFRALLFFLASSLVGFGQSSILVTNLAEQRVEGQKFVREFLSLRPEANSSAKGVIKIHDQKGITTDVSVRFQTIVNSNNWQTVYDAVATNGYEAKLTVTRTDGRTNRYCLEQVQKTRPFGNSFCHTQPWLGGNETMIPFAGSDFWLADLGLEFLHWPEQRLIKKEMRKSIFCKVIESINPQSSSNGYSRVVSWIKHDAPAIVHADVYDANNKLLKVFEPKAVEKVDGQYQLREMEMLNVQTKSRTRIEFDLDGK